MRADLAQHHLYFWRDPLADAVCAQDATLQVPSVRACQPRSCGAAIGSALVLGAAPCYCFYLWVRSGLFTSGIAGICCLCTAPARRVKADARSGVKPDHVCPGMHLLIGGSAPLQIALPQAAVNAQLMNPVKYGWCGDAGPVVCGRPGPFAGRRLTWLAYDGSCMPLLPRCLRHLSRPGGGHPDSMARRRLRRGAGVHRRPAASRRTGFSAAD